MLTPEQKQQFIDEGYVRVPGLIDPDVVAAVKRNLLLSVGIDESNPSSWDTSQSLPDADDVLSTTIPARTEAVESVAEQLIGPDFLRGVSFSPFLEWRHKTPVVNRGFIPVLGFPVPSPTEPPAWAMPDGFHIDGGGYVVTYPTTNFLAVMVYLSDVPQWGGATTVHPGSHRQVFDHWLHHPDVAGRGVPALDYAPAIPLPAQTGDAVFMHYLLVHSGSANFAPHIRLGLNTGVMPHPGKPYRPKSGPPQEDWTPLDFTLRTDTL